MKLYQCLMHLLVAMNVTATVFAANKSVYDFEAKTIKGDILPLKHFAGDVLLIVNTASGCGFTPQYKGLQEIYKKFKPRGFQVLGFPSNDFGGQEPKSNKEIKDFCELNYKVEFPLFSKVIVSGPAKTPLFKHLTENSGPQLKREIDWNFEKFLVSRRGIPVARFKSMVEPNSKELTDRIESLLQETRPTK